jgi:hypothetical protein
LEEKMASPLTAALKPLVSADEDADIKYQTALERIEAALSARESGGGFDPTLLAMAQGFLAPTKTGSFGESLGQAAGAVLPVQQQRQKDAMDNAQMRLQLAQAQREQSQLSKAQKAFQGRFGSGPSAPTEATGDATGEAPEGGGKQKMRTVTVQDALDFASAFPKQKDMADMLFKAAQAGSDRYKVAMNGTVFDSWDGEYINKPVPGQTQSDYNIPGIGTFKMTPFEYDAAKTSLQKAKKEGWEADWAKQFKRGIETPTKPSVVSEGEVLTGGRLTTSESEASAAAAKKVAEKTAEAKVDATTLAKTAGKAALGLIPLYDRAEGILASTPKLKESLGVLEKGDLASAIGTVADEGVQVGSVKVNIPSFRKIASQYSQDPKVINALAELAQIEAMWQFQQRQGLGSGTSVSNFEQQMVNQMGPNIKDPYDAYRKKLQFMKAKADFDRAVARELKGSMQYEDFESTKKFEELFNAYQKKIMPIVYGSESKPAQRSGNVNPNATSKLKSLLE